MKRREFIKSAAGVTLAGILGRYGDLSAYETSSLQESLFEDASSPEVLTLAERVTERCVLRMIMKPQDAQYAPCLQNHWIIPGGPDNCIKNPDVPTPIGMAFAKGDPALAKFLADLVKEMKPKIDASLAKYSSLEQMLPK